jgi:hypothetical protein
LLGSLSVEDKENEGVFEDKKTKEKYNRYTR